jgi:hypothetical protein
MTRRSRRSRPAHPTTQARRGGVGAWIRRQPLYQRIVIALVGLFLPFAIVTALLWGLPLRGYWTFAPTIAFALLLLFPFILLFRSLRETRSGGRLFLVGVLGVLLLVTTSFTARELLSGTRLVSAEITECRFNVSRGGGWRNRGVPIYRVSSVGVVGGTLNELYFVSVPDCTPGTHLLLLTNASDYLLEIDPPGADPADAVPLRP